MNSVQRLFRMAVMLAVGLGLAASGYASVLINDTWQDADRTDPASPTYSENGADSDFDTDLESAWFFGGSGGLTATTGHLIMSNSATASSSYTTYIAPGGASLTLANPGDELKITWAFSNLGANIAQNSGQNMRLALVNGATRLTADGVPADQNFPGYALFLNMGTITGRTTPYQLLERTTINGNLLATSANWTSRANAPGFGNAATGYAYGGTTIYTNVWSLKLINATDLEIGISMSGGNLNGSGFVSVVFTDSTPVALSFDTFALRPSNASTTAEQFDTTLFKVEFIPEPSTVALVGSGLAAMIAALRRRRR
jgi:hypothetical protein